MQNLSVESTLLMSITPKLANILKIISIKISASIFTNVSKLIFNILMKKQSTWNRQHNTEKVGGRWAEDKDINVMQSLMQINHKVFYKTTLSNAAFYWGKSGHMG